MSSSAFTALLTETLGNASAKCRDGAIAFVCMDWRHMGELLAAGALVLDPFAGSGTTLIAAPKTGRAARVIEYDPGYCDQIIARFERLTGKGATLAENGMRFEDVREARLETELEAA